MLPVFLVTGAEIRCPNRRFATIEARDLTKRYGRVLAVDALSFDVRPGVVTGFAVGVNTKNSAEDLTNNALAGVSAGLLLIGVLGVLTTTSEYTSGMIRATLAAVPNRPVVLAAKAAVLGTVALALGEATSFISFFAGSATLRNGIAAPALGQPGVLRAVALGRTRAVAAAWPGSRSGQRSLTAN